jgi:deazaflavin-dependent oxidoreductase (nitroreductase family)
MAVADMMASLAARALTNRHLVRAPIRVYRAGLGFLFGRRTLMLGHRGRVSGLWRFVVLEVVDHPAPDVYVVVAGFGTRAQWYRNVLADPSVRLWCGLRRDVRATATPMSESESAVALRAYAERHPRAWRMLRATIENAVGHSVEALPMVRLTIDPSHASR